MKKLITLLILNFWATLICFGQDLKANQNYAQQNSRYGGSEVLKSLLMNPIVQICIGIAIIYWAASAFKRASLSKEDEEWRKKEERFWEEKRERERKRRY
ncbi:MAG: hypothetical protein WAT19_14400 [Ferruginibacter sp.]